LIDRVKFWNVATDDKSANVEDGESLIMNTSGLGVSVTKSSAAVTVIVSVTSSKPPVLTVKLPLVGVVKSALSAIFTPSDLKIFQ